MRSKLPFLPFKPDTSKGSNMAEIGSYCPHELCVCCKWLQLCLLIHSISPHLGGCEMEFTHPRWLSISVLENDINTRTPSVSLPEFGH